MIIARDVVIEAGARTLLSDASVSVQTGDKIGLVGPNGAGKTTFMRSLAGETEPASGHIARSGRIGYLSQEAALDRARRRRDHGARAHSDGAVDRRSRAPHGTDPQGDGGHATGEERDRLIKRFARLEDEFTAAGGYVAKAEAKRFAFSLGIEQRGAGSARRHDVRRGQRRRVELAQDPLRRDRRAAAR